MRHLKIYFLVLLILLSGCVTTPQSVLPYSSENRSHLYSLQKWSLEGRLAIVNKHDSWQANIDWQHTPDSEIIKLTGPLGQGGALIELNDGGVIIDRGGGDVQTATNSEEFISQQIGLFVPVKALRYWVLGLPDLHFDIERTESGFQQLGWINLYKEMQQIDAWILPKKMTVNNVNTKLKLFIEKWTIDE